MFMQARQTRLFCKCRLYVALPVHAWVGEGLKLQAYALHTPWDFTEEHSIDSLTLREEFMMHSTVDVFKKKKKKPVLLSSYESPTTSCCLETQFLSAVIKVGLGSELMFTLYACLRLITNAQKYQVILPGSDLKIAQQVA